MRIGICGVDGSHADDFIRHFNVEARYPGHGIAAVWGGTPERTAELLAQSEALTAADSLDALIGLVDAVIVGDRHGGLHRVHALPCIAAGKPVFIDKPLANSPADAEAIVVAAETAGVPLLSGSALRWQGKTSLVKAQVAAIAGPVQVRAWGTWFPDNEYGGAVYYAIHAIELAQELTGPDWSDVAVSRVGEGMLVSYRSTRGPATVDLRPPAAGGGTGFGAEVDGIAYPIMLGDDYMEPVCAEIVRMLETGRSRLSGHELLAPVRLMAAIEGELRRS